MEDVGAVVVTYHPEPELALRLESLCQAVAFLVVVDNGSSAETLAPVAALAARGDLILISNPDNRGIATALNQGADALRSHALTWGLLLDQDSEPDADMVQRLRATARHCEDQHPAVVAPNVIDRGMSQQSRRWLSLDPVFGLGFTRTTCHAARLTNVVAITSGSLVDLDLLHALGGFDEGLFIDFVDTDYCLRAAAAGYPTIIDCSARLTHSVGAKQRKGLLGIRITPTYHSPLRRYYLFRNRVHMIRAHAARWPHWLLYEAAATLQVLAGILFFEPHKRAQLRACLLGAWDGLRGRTGQATRNFSTG